MYGFVYVLVYTSKYIFILNIPRGRHGNRSVIATDAVGHDPVVFFHDISVIDPGEALGIQFFLA